MTEQPMERPECDHHWITYMQPSAGLSWIRQCSQCRDFDADDLQEQIAAAEQRGVELIVRVIRQEAFDAAGHEWVHPDQELHDIADFIIKKYSADQEEGDDGDA